jgi:hypothetical protein
MSHIAQQLHGCMNVLFIIKYRIAARTSPGTCLYPVCTITGTLQCPVLSPGTSVLSHHLVHVCVLYYHLEHGCALYYINGTLECPVLSPGTWLCPVLSLLHCSVLCYHLVLRYALYFYWYTVVSCAITCYVAIHALYTVVSCAITGTL